jgi:hypothetical protein
LLSSEHISGLCLCAGAERAVKGSKGLMRKEQASEDNRQKSGRQDLREKHG